MQKCAQYIDDASGVVKKPDAFDNDPFGDSVWRSSWFYASLILLKALDPPTYQQIEQTHQVGVEGAGTFLSFFRQHCLESDGWSLPKNPTQRFSRDQLVPLLFLLEVVVKHEPRFKDDGKAILRSLVELEEDGKPLSDTLKGRIGRNLGYLIDVLCDHARYNLIYRTEDMPMFLIPCLGNIDCAQGNRRGAYKTLFGLALDAQEIGGFVLRAGLDVTDEYSVFNALGAVSRNASPGARTTMMSGIGAATSSCTRKTAGVRRSISSRGAVRRTRRSTPGSMPM